jgi:hypothetical protein
MYAKTAGMDLIFDLNALLRSGKDWDDKNAIELLNFANSHNLKISWQLGNGKIAIQCSIKSQKLITLQSQMPTGTSSRRELKLLSWAMIFTTCGNYWTHTPNTPNRCCLAQTLLVPGCRN